jgi:ABC-type branched-subunit amino acid transport system substrate-binding protein
VAAAVAAVSLVVVACGQYPGTHERGLISGEATGTGSLGGPGTTPVGGGIPTTGGPTTGGTIPTTGGTTGGSVGGSGPTGPTGPGNVVGHTTSGVTASNITIGIHAPITGAAPVTDDSFIIGKDLYWRYGDQGSAVRIYGRTVSALVENDKYNPTEATLVCQKMVQQDKAFLLIGGAGTDQIVACAKYAATQPGPVPYLSAGVTQDPLERYGNYFALSMSYPQQVPLLVEYIQNKLRVNNPNRVAMVATNTANFDDAVEAWEREFPGTDVYRPNKNDGPVSWGQRLCTGPLDKYDVVFPLVAPLFWLEMAQAATCHPRWAGVGITMGVDAVAEATCALGYRTNDAHFFSPAPAFTDVATKEKTFMAAARKKGEEPDDIMWLLWGLSAGIHQLLLKPGPDLSRERFIQASTGATVDGQGFFPDIKYAPNNHFGATAVNVLRLNCPATGTGHWLTEARDVTGF